MTIEAALALTMFTAAALVAAVTTGPRRRVALLVALGIVAMRAFVEVAPDAWRYLASCAVWVSVGAAATRRGLSGAGVCFIASGLCYAVQEVTRLPPLFGNPALVAADLFWWFALAGVYRGRLAGVSDQVGDLDRLTGGRRHLACHCADGLEAAAREVKAP